ncbi:hypothetical protein ACA910_013394 [Epithemia clementina (nom. ined.)]
MVRGNWQKRVETAEARRRETKQRKLKSDEKRIFKGWVHDLWQTLDQYESTIRKRQSTIHLWSDMLPSSSPPLLDLLQESPKKRGGGRPRSSSIESEGSAGGGTRRGGGGSGSNSKKKVHPRSKEAQQQQEAVSTTEPSDQDGFAQLLLCQSHFLYGKCSGGGGGGGSSSAANANPKKACACRYFHYSSSSNKYLTLANVLQKDSHNNNSNNSGSDDLMETQKQVEAALKSSSLLSDVDTEGAMEMLYYSFVQASNHTGQVTTVNSNTVPTSLSDDIVYELSRTQTPMASIVYVAVDGRLVFDRNQEGGILSGIGERLLGNQQARSRQNSIAENHDEELHQFPGAVLIHILTFLPDAAVAMCCQVCRAWNNEIGKIRSPHLWLHLLKRRNWSAPPTLTEPSTTATVNHTTMSSNPGGAISATTASEIQRQEDYAVECRTLFQNHYAIVRDVRALASAVPSILSTATSLHNNNNSSRQFVGAAAAATNSLNEKEVAFQAFASRKFTPNESDTCIALQQWSPNHILAGYAKDCTLRLFQATAASSGSRLSCRELVCCSIDPYKATKKRTCTLDAVGLDETTIGCLCHVSAQHLQESCSPVSGTAFILVVLSRDNFLLGESDALSKEGLEVIDIGQAVLNFILASDVVDHRLLPLFDFLNDSYGQVGNVTTIVSRHCIASCGYGRFMVEVSISIPNDQTDDEDENANVETMIQLDRKLVLFSANTHAIVWMGDSYPTPQVVPPASTIPAVVASRRQPYTTGGPRTACAIVATSVASPPSLLLSCSIERTGNVQVPRIIENSDVIRHSLVPQGFRSLPSQCLLVCPSNIVAMETIYKVNDEEEEGDDDNDDNNSGEPNEFKTILTFFAQSPYYNDGEIPLTALSTSALHLSGNVRAHKMVSVRDDYIIVLCSELITPFLPVVDASDTDELVGQWFAPRDQRMAPSQPVHSMLVIHIPSRQEIGRIPFAKNVDYDSIKPRISTLSGDTIALALGGLGIVMTGHDVRDLVGPSANGNLYILGDLEVDGTKTQKPKKKPGRARKGGGKKDGFARGMSLRG